MVDYIDPDFFTRAMFQNVCLLNYVFRRFRISSLSLRKMTPGPMIHAMTGLMQKQATQHTGRAASLQHSPYQCSMYAIIKTFMIEANDSVNHVAEERGHNEWAVRRIGIKSNAFRIVRTDPDAELKYDCECGMPELMCRHILAVVKSSAERRRLATEGGIGNKIDNFQAFTTYAVRAPYEDEVLLQNQKSMLSSNVVMPELRRQRGRPKMKRALPQGEKHTGEVSSEPSCLRDLRKSFVGNVEMLDIIVERVRR
jgi:hypothetical protein